MLIPKTQILVRFALLLAVSEIKGRQKAEMPRETPNWTWRLNSQTYSIYTLNTYPWGPNFGPVVSNISHILYFLIDYHLKCQKKKDKKNTKNSKFEISQFFIQHW